jgi:hypothetical protein
MNEEQISLEEQINLDIKESILRKENQRLEALRAIKTSIQVEKAKDGSEFLTDEQVIKIVQKLIAQSTESASMYKQGNRFDLVDHEMLMINQYEVYLPAQLPIEQITEKIKEIINYVGATTIRDMGKVMAECTKVFAGSADNKTIGQIVKTQLS